SLQRLEGADNGLDGASVRFKTRRLNNQAFELRILQIMGVLVALIQGLKTLLQRLGRRGTCGRGVPEPLIPLRWDAVGSKESAALPARPQQLRVSRLLFVNLDRMWNAGDKVVNNFAHVVLKLTHSLQGKNILPLPYGLGLLQVFWEERVCDAIS